MNTHSDPYFMPILVETRASPINVPLPDDSDVEELCTSDYHASNCKCENKKQKQQKKQKTNKKVQFKNDQDAFVKSFVEQMKVIDQCRDKSYDHKQERENYMVQLSRKIAELEKKLESIKETYFKDQKTLYELKSEYFQIENKIKYENIINKYKYDNIIRNYKYNMPTFYNHMNI